MRWALTLYKADLCKFRNDSMTYIIKKQTSPGPQMKHESEDDVVVDTLLIRMMELSMSKKKLPYRKRLCSWVPFFS